MKTAIVALVVFMTLGITLSSSLLELSGVETNYVYIGLGALLITSLVAFRSIGLIVIVLLVSLPINLSEEYLIQYYIDRDVLIVLVILMIIFPFAYSEFVGKK
ncbi:MAG: hypothetical protein HOH14_03830 [Gammaproteobacteria bacterium]|jgi:glucose-6-phosphate-specific signal transduction histidine kinase|nr:hypothetical protein [Gammaproteobacteria bacterium]MBT6042606.1 hypothetical protein [Gammaproteobacteria bacterium]